MVQFDKKRHRIHRMLVISLLFLTAFLSVAPWTNFAMAGDVFTNPDEQYESVYDWDGTLATLSSDYIGYTTFMETYASNDGSLTSVIDPNKTIRIDTAEELYRFSVDVSLSNVHPATEYPLSESAKAMMLGFDYVLGDDIDYSGMGASGFIPVGYDFQASTQQTYQKRFSGTFDGRGFEIKNLSLSTYYADYVYEDIETDVTISPYYAMFPFNDGTIQNIGLIDPDLALADYVEGMNQVSYLVGENNGNVNHVYVIDHRIVDDAGIRHNVTPAPGTITASGVVHEDTPQANTHDAYYVGTTIVNPTYANRYDAQPIIHDDPSGTTDHLVYDHDIYATELEANEYIFDVSTPSSAHEAVSTNELKNGTVHLDDQFYYYPQEGYPLLRGLNYDTNQHAYLIEDGWDLAFLPDAFAMDSETFYQEGYLLTADIDMSVVGPSAYETPSRIFSGTFSGEAGDPDVLTDNHTIHNLTITQGYDGGDNHYIGLFSVVNGGGRVHGFNLENMQINVVGSNDYYSDNLYVGTVAGRLSGGVIEQIIVDGTIDLGDEALGVLRAGGITGEAYGTISQVSFDGAISGGSHLYADYQQLTFDHRVGGILGSTATQMLHLFDVVNHGDVHSPAHDPSSAYAQTLLEGTLGLGGIIGMIDHTIAIHTIYDATNKGDLYVGDVHAFAPAMTMYAGGIFGSLTGMPPVLEDEEGAIRFADFFNHGTIHADAINNPATIKAAGIGVNLASANVEYVRLFNHGSFDFGLDGDLSQVTPNKRYVALVYDASDYEVRLSRAYNYGDMIYDGAYLSEISGLYHSDKNNPTYLRFVENHGDIDITGFSMASDFTVAAITVNENTDYLNVSNHGDVTIASLDMGNHDLFISAMAKTLVSGNRIKNSLNQGTITVANIDTNANVYVGGLTVFNEAGELDNYTLDAALPVTNTGIINSINYGDITTTDSDFIHGLYGTGNLITGGIVALNSGSIQDVSNLGDITLHHTNETGSSTFSPETENNYTASIIEDVESGIVAGGVAGITLSSHSRVYDSANNGVVIIKAYDYARAGGVVGVSLYQEAVALGITPTEGLEDSIQQSVLSNGLNFGMVSAITSVIGTYSETQIEETVTLFLGDGTPNQTGGLTYTETTTEGTFERPPVHAVAGGVIAYGLSVMRRMLNHGEISSTDVAGGIVGATYVLGGEDLPLTVVNINTAINYGLIKSLASADYASIDGKNLSGDLIAGYYLADGNAFLYPDGMTREMPRGKRGFGGIFGRLQRGLNGIMTAEGGSFDFIVNANPSIDLIGRLDQVYNFSSSSRFFRFNDAIYYSAKLDDTTQIVFTGFYYSDEVYVSDIVYLGRDRWWFWWIYYWDIHWSADSQYHQQGVHATYETMDPEEVDVQETSSFGSDSGYDIGDTETRYYYHGAKEMPWITEDPNDLNITDSDTQYMYDEDFPMRADPSLTEYIFYADNILLADRFRLASGDLYREDGMYVLSTSGGKTYGSVLPANLYVPDLNPIDEENATLSYDIEDGEYAEISIVHRKTIRDVDDTDPDTVYTSYQHLRQTRFNDQSALIGGSDFTFVMNEDEGSETVLEEGTFDEQNKRVTFTMSLEAFNTPQASYAITAALTSEYALMAMTPSDYVSVHGGTVTDLQSDLQNDTITMGISETYAPLLDVAVPQTATSGVYAGSFTVYSEAFVGDAAFASPDYYTTYDVYINFTAALTDPNDTRLDRVRFNDGTNVNDPTDYSLTDTADLTGSHAVDVFGSIELTFEDTAGILNEGYDFADLFKLYYDTTLVNSDHYTVTSVAVDASGTYSILFDFSSLQIRGGTYTIGYSFFPTSDPRYLLFTKAGSSAKDITDMDYFSADGSFDAISDTSEVDMAVLMEEGLFDGVISSSSEPGYLPTASYPFVHDFGPDAYQGSITLSPFAVVTDVTMSETMTSGIKSYVYTFTVEAEDGSTAQVSHTIHERAINVTAVHKNNNEVALGNVFADREARSTQFCVDLGLNSYLDYYRVEATTYPYFEVTLSGEDFSGAPVDLIGIDINGECERLQIIMDEQTLPGIYEFSFVFHRDDTNAYVLPDTLTITKNQNDNAYLNNITFNSYVSSTTYPDICLTDEAGTYDCEDNPDLVPYTPDPAPQVYGGGIDYDGAKTIGYSYFRVTGYVANIPLEYFLPGMVDYLPLGASISRQYYDTMSETWQWTTPVDATSSEAEIEDALSGNFVTDPESNQNGTEAIKVTYKVTSEDGAHEVLYHVSVTDVSYNVSFIFDFYYCQDDSRSSCVIIEDETSPLMDDILLLDVRNMIVSEGGSVVPVTSTPMPTPPEFPTYDALVAEENRMRQFIYAHPSEYVYRFGRNKAGMYLFSVDLPTDDAGSNLYDYTIVYDIDDGTTVETYELNDFGLGKNGKYFYIHAAPYNRNRRFSVYVYPDSSSQEQGRFGFFDWFTSWFD